MSGTPDANGAAVLQTPLVRAQERLKAAIGQQPFDHVKYTIAGYMSGVLQSAHLDAMKQLMCEGCVVPNATWASVAEYLEHLITFKVTELAELIEKQAAQSARIQVASAVPARSWQ